MERRRQGVIIEPIFQGSAGMRIYTTTIFKIS